MCVWLVYRYYACMTLRRLLFVSSSGFTNLWPAMQMPPLFEPFHYITLIKDRPQIRHWSRHWIRFFIWFKVFFTTNPWHWEMLQQQHVALRVKFRVRFLGWGIPLPFSGSATTQLATKIPKRKAFSESVLQDMNRLNTESNSLYHNLLG